MDGINFSIAHSAEMILRAKRLCHDVYLQMGYINKPYPDGVLPGRDDTSIYIVAMNRYHEVAGTVRLSWEVPSNFFDPWQGKLFASCASLIGNAMRQRSFSIGSLAVNKAYAGLRVSSGLYQMAYEWALRHNMAFGIMSMDHRAFRALKMVGWYAVQVGDAAWYLGSPTIPAIIPIGEQNLTPALSDRVPPLALAVAQGKGDVAYARVGSPRLHSAFASSSIPSLKKRGECVAYHTDFDSSKSISYKKISMKISA